jgi:mannose-6-phosphate isomerase-like protein (cupin superfamily)
METIEPIYVEDLMLDTLLNHPLVYDQNLVKVIDKGGCYEIRSVAEYIEAKELDNLPIKLEGAENLSEKLYSVSRKLAELFNHPGHVSCHVFISGKGSISFDTHTDPDDVFLYVVQGSKTMIVDGVERRIDEGMELFIPHNTPHKANNIEASIMLSFGLERFMLDKVVE